MMYTGVRSYTSVLQSHQTHVQICAYQNCRENDNFVIHVYDDFVIHCCMIVHQCAAYPFTPSLTHYRSSCIIYYTRHPLTIYCTNYLPHLTDTPYLNASLISSSESVSFIFRAIIVKNSGKSIVPFPVCERIERKEWHSKQEDLAHTY